MKSCREEGVVYIVQVAQFSNNTNRAATACPPVESSEAVNQCWSTMLYEEQKLLLLRKQKHSQK